EVGCPPSLVVVFGRGTSKFARERDLPALGIGLAPEVGGLPSRPNHAPHWLRGPALLCRSAMVIGEEFRNQPTTKPQPVRTVLLLSAREHTRCRVAVPSLRLLASGVSGHLPGQSLHALDDVRGEILFHDRNIRLGTRPLQHEVLIHSCPAIGQSLVSPSEAE